MSSHQELPTIIPEEFYDKYSVVFSEFNLDKKIVRIGRNEEQSRTTRLAYDTRGIIRITNERNNSRISGERYSLQKLNSISSKVSQGNGAIN